MATFGIFGGSFHQESGSLTQRYEEGNLERLDVLHPLVTIESIYAVQSLAMGILRHRSRTKLKDVVARKYGFAMYNDSLADDEVAYNGASEEYMSYRVRKVAYDQWKMRIRFRQNELSEETRRESYIDDYMFDWMRNGDHMAWFSNRKVSAWEGHTFEDITTIEPLDEAQIADLQQRMIEVTNTVNPAGSIFNHQAISARMNRYLISED
jgi:hypothetical protein